MDSHKPNSQLISRLISRLINQLNSQVISSQVISHWLLTTLHRSIKLTTTIPIKCRKTRWPISRLTLWSWTTMVFQLKEAPVHIQELAAASASKSCAAWRCLPYSQSFKVSVKLFMLALLSRMHRQRRRTVSSWPTSFCWSSCNYQTSSTYSFKASGSWRTHWRPGCVLSWASKLWCLFKSSVVCGNSPEPTSFLDQLCRYTCSKRIRQILVSETVSALLQDNVVLARNWTTKLDTHGLASSVALSWLLC